MSELTSSYVLGIDLGTTRSALAYVDLDLSESDALALHVLRIPQLDAPGVLLESPMLPSAVYLPHPDELRPADLALPWRPHGEDIVGSLALRRGAEVPGRLVHGAKSWLCHTGVDRRAALLPLDAPPDVRKISPLEASRRILEHLVSAWNARQPDAPAAQLDVVVTVPASFDPVARELTAEAAAAVGLERLTLLEEPQAALYAWIAGHGSEWRNLLRVGDRVLVVDVGGGTTDFSLVAVEDDGAGSLALRRIAVGDHILLGGDNMDLALAHALRERLRAEGRALDAWQMRQLVLACQAAKERLLGEQPPESITVAIAGRGSQLVGGSIGVPLSRDEAERILIEGFLPHCEPDARPQRRARAALTELGLPYASDPAITRQLAAFLARHAEATGARELARPTAILFNGGVWRSARLRERLLEVVGQWMKRLGAPTPRVLHGADLDLGCARGAAAYAAFRLRRGVRIRGGTARAFYVGVEAAVPAVPGLPPPVRAHCIAPFGMEEGSSAPPLPLELGLVVGEPVQFRFFSSSVRRDDVVGDVVERVEELDELPPIEATVPTEAGAEGDVVPVRLVASVTEVGVLRVEAVSRDGAHRHRVELDAREGRS